MYVHCLPIRFVWITLKRVRSFSDFIADGINGEFSSVVLQPVKEHTFFAMSIPTEHTGVWDVCRKWRNK